eukprot:jgi/Undpi1/11763/HiC_scaffold_37.g14058.m1
MPVDPVRLEVVHHLLAAVCEEAGTVLQRSAISPNIRERRDFSVALFDGEGRLVGQAAHIPVHLGSAAAAVEAVRSELDLAPGDTAIVNDPYRGGTHLPDVTLVRPVFARGARAPRWFLLCRAHHADIGGSTPGSMGLAVDLIAEGLVLPPVHLRRRDQEQRDVWALIAANVRGAPERMADLRAQEACVRVAEQRLGELEAQLGAREVTRYAGHLMDYTERLAGAEIAGLPEGTWSAKDIMESDGAGNGPFDLAVELAIAKGRMRFDFSRTADQAMGGINANRSITIAACVYVLRCLCPSRLPTNDGLFRLLDVVTRPGSLVDPLHPAPVAGGNVETSQRLVDVVLQAVAKAAPQLVPASSAGTMTNLCIGGHTGDFATYETLPGGAGAGGHGDGASALQTHMTNTRNTPVEECERRLPLRVTRLGIRSRSGGAGRHRGGDGLIKEVVALEPVQVSLLAERHERGPRGAKGGGEGAAGRLRVRRAGKRRLEAHPGKTEFSLDVGDAVTVETPGGGGYGKARRT